MLEEWRRELARIEREAGHYRSADVQLLVGAAVVAIEDLLKERLRKEKNADPSSDAA
jgi:hypothetical protein